MMTVFVADEKSVSVQTDWGSETTDEYVTLREWQEARLSNWLKEAHLA